MVLSADDNRLLTEVGPGTRMGALLRRYWHPIAALGELDKDPIRPVRLLGEELVLYRDKSGALGLVERRCPHRGADLAYGIVERGGLRCSYHGWCFDARGRCVEQPYEEVVHPDGRFRERVVATAYPVRAKAGLVWAYLGPEPAPCLMDWAHFHERGDPTIVITRVPCNWLQCQENSVDPLHFEWLHQNLPNDRFGSGQRAPRHLELDFEEFEFGFIYRRVMDNTDKTHPLWSVGRVSLWPECLFAGDAFVWHVPIDDQQTLDVTWDLRPGMPPRPNAPVACRRTELRRAPDGRYSLHDVQHQDAIAMVGQGVIADRGREHLGEGDRGVIMLRKRLLAEVEAVAEGREPKGIVRDEARNQRVPLPYVGMTPEQRAGARPRGTRLQRLRAKARDALTKLRVIEAKVARGIPLELPRLRVPDGGRAALAGAGRSARELAKRLTGGRRREPDGPNLGAMIHGYRRSALLYVVAKLGVADALAGGPRTADELGRELGAHGPSLGRILRALANDGVFREEGDRFALTAAGDRLRSAAPRSVRGTALLAGEEYMPAWTGLLHTARTGETAFDHVFGMSNWQHRREHPELNDAFNAMIANGSEWSATRLAETYELARVTRLTDVGGGNGTFLAHVLNRQRHLRGTLFDLPHVVAGAPALLEKMGVGGRCDVVGGDFFEAVPPGADAYLLKNVLHNWQDEPALAILTACRKAMGTTGPHARVLVLEAPLPTRPTHGDGRVFSDIHMMAVDGGRERTEAGYRALLEAAGLTFVRTLPLAAEVALIEARVA